MLQMDDLKHERWVTSFEYIKLSKKNFQNTRNIEQSFSVPSEFGKTRIHCILINIGSYMALHTDIR